MSLTGKGHVEFDDDPDNPAGTAPRKGVVDFGDDESPPTHGTNNDHDSRIAGKKRFRRPKARISYALEVWMLRSLWAWVLKLQNR